MKPRTRLEKLVAGLSEKLPAITKAQEEWAKEHVFDHVAYKCKNELWCSECGEIWLIRVIVNWVTRPNALIATIN